MHFGRVIKSLFAYLQSRFPALAAFLFQNHGSKDFGRLPAGPTFVTKSSKSSGELAAPPSPRPSLSGTLLAPLSARRYLILHFNAPFIVGMRALLQVFEAFRHEASFKTVLPPIGAAAPVTSVPAGSYAGFKYRNTPLQSLRKQRV